MAKACRTTDWARVELASEVGDGRNRLCRLGEGGSAFGPLGRNQSAEQSRCTESVNRLSRKPGFAVDCVGPLSGDVFADPFRLGYQVGRTHQGRP